MINLFISRDIDYISSIITKCYDRNPELAKWALKWLHDEFDTELLHDCLVCEPEVWYVDDDKYEWVYPEAYDGKDAVEKYVDENDFEIGELVSKRSYRKAVRFDGNIIEINKWWYTIIKENEDYEE